LHAKNGEEDKGTNLHKHEPCAQMKNKTKGTSFSEEEVMYLIAILTFTKDFVIFDQAKENNTLIIVEK
jgi:hypothetical protein